MTHRFNRFRHLALWCLFCCCTALAGMAQASPLPLVITEASKNHELGPWLSILEDKDGSLTFEQVSEPGMEKRFIPNTRRVPGFGFSASVYWARFHLDYQDTQNDAWFLEFAYPPMQWIDVYTVTERFEVSHQKGGSGVRFAERPFGHHSHLFKLRLNPGDKLTVYVRIAGESSKTLPMVMRRSDAFAAFASTELLIMGIYFGTIVGLILYNLFIFNSVREPAYVWYIMFLIGFAMMALTTQGLAAQYLWPDHPHWTMHALPLLIAATIMFACLFAIHFIDTASLSTGVHRLMLLATWLCVPVALVAVGSSYHIAILAGAGLVVTYPILLLVVGVFAVLKGNVSARYYLLAWVFVLVGSFATGLRAFEWVPPSLWTDYGAYIGSGAEAILLSIALAARLRWLRDEKDTARQRLLDTLRQQSDLLEDQVAARTHELIKTQRDLVSKDRLASMGVLTAGVIHEIQNPNNFIRAGAANIAAGIEDFEQTLPDRHLDDESRRDLAARLAALRGQVTLVEDGSRRITSIVEGLRTVSQLSQAGQQECDVMDGLEKAVAMLQPVFGEAVSFHVEIAARPRILCWPEELAQVFMSVLNNACQAVVERQRQKNDASRGQVRVNAQQKGRDLWVSIEDDGIGMTAEIEERAFDPFFTTREVGMGAGLGLTLSRDIVSKHAGKLLLMSEPGAGTVVRIILPVVSE
jgi:two-component system NtrC family sensor kinase